MNQPGNQGHPDIPQGYAPHAGMQYPQAYPPQKQGIPGWGWALIGCGGLFVVFMIVSVLALAAIPLITSNTRDARMSEAEHLLGSARNLARVRYSKFGEPPHSLTGPYDRGGADVPEYELQGMYYQVEDRVTTPYPGYGGLTATPHYAGSDPTARMEFSWNTGESDLAWSP
jgi:type II secretory pathway pseudopilin PulG